MSKVQQESVIKTSLECHPLEELKDELTHFLATVESCLGPRASLKMTVSSSGHTTATSSSARLWDLIQVDHVLAQFILQSTKRLPDHRLLASALAARLLIHSEAGGTDDGGLDTLADAIEESAVSFDMSDLGLLVSFVKTVIRPKAKAIGLLNTEIDNLGAKIVRAWLATVPDDGDGEMGEVIVKVVEGGGCEEVAIVEGLLCPHETTFDREFPDIEGPVKVALYNIMMDKHQAGDSWEGEAMELEYDAEAEAGWGQVDILPRLAGLDVGLVASQKAVAWEAARSLRRAGVRVLDRLGTQAFRRLERLAGGRAVSSATQQLTEADLGSLASATNLTVAGRRFVRLRRLGARPGQVVSLVLGSLGEQQADELEDVTRRSLAALTELLTQPRPRVLPGAGCLEARLALQLPGLRRPLLRLALVPGGVELAGGLLDPGTGHLYSGQPGAACQCGLVPAPDTRPLVPLLEVYHNTATYSLHTPVTMAGGSSLVLDSLTFKKASILTAVETAENLSNIGMIITC